MIRKILLFLILCLGPAYADLFPYVGVQIGYGAGDTKIAFQKRPGLAGVEGRNLFGVNGIQGGAVAGVAFSGTSFYTSIEANWGVENQSRKEDQIYYGARTSFHLKRTCSTGVGLLLGYKEFDTVLLAKVGAQSSFWTGKMFYPAHTQLNETVIFLDRFITMLSVGCGIQTRLNSKVSGRILYSWDRALKKHGKAGSYVKVRPHMHSIVFSLIFHA